MEKLPTIKEIAKQLKVSVSTVSRALSNHPRIGISTRERVQKLAAELGYEPNAQAIFFKQKKTFVIGVIVPNIREEFFSQAISGIEEAAMEHQYTILFGQSYDDPARENAVIDTMKKQRVDGLIISLSKNTHKFEHLESLKKYEIPVVFFDRVPNTDDAHKVYCDLRKGTEEMVNWLFNKKYRRIAIIDGPQKMRASQERLNGYKDGFAKRKLKVDMQMVEYSDLSQEGTHHCMKKLLALKQPPQAIITFNEYVHMDATQYARKQGIIVNKEIVFASYANLSITGYTAYPPLLTIEQYPYLQGEKAMEIMLSLLGDASKKKPDGFVHEVIAPTLVATIAP